MSDYQAGQEVIWIGTGHLFEHRVRIAAVRRSYLAIFGETPAGARTVYDLADPVLKTIVLGIPADQLFPTYVDALAAQKADALKTLGMEV